MLKYCLFIFLLLTGLSQDLWARWQYVPMKTNKHPSFRYHEGYLIDSNKDTLRGNIKFGAMEHWDEALLFKADSDKHARRIVLKHILYLRVFAADSTLTGEGYTEFFGFDTPDHKPTLFREIHKGQTRLYDLSRYTDECPSRLSASLYVLQNGHLEAIEGSALLDPKQILLRYYNKTYNKDLRMSDAKDIRTLLDQFP